VARYPPPLPGAPGTDGAHRSQPAVREEFWAVYFELTRLLPDDAEDEAAGDRHPTLDPARLDAWYAAELASATAWPVLPLPLPGGRAVRVVFRNAPEDAGVDYLVDDPAWPRPLVLARLEGHFAGPGLRWAEARAVADTLGGGAPAGGLAPSWARLLALLPLVTDADPPPEAGPRIGAAFRDGAATVPWFAALAAGGPGGADAGRSGWWAPVRWRRDARRGWVNDGAWSVRNPDGPCPLTDAEFDRLREFFAGLGAG
jgi:hypothetical protein